MNSPEELATQVCFKDTAFLMARGLSPDNILEYLSLSQFYDPSCLNEQLRMQARFSNALVSSVSSGGESADTRARRLGMRGLEYELWFSVPSPSLFVIRRQMRQSPTRVDLTGILYIIDGTIYQAPSIESLLQARLLTAHHHLSKGLQSLEQSARFAPSLVPQGSDPCLWAEQVERWENARKDLLAKDALKNNSTDTHNATTPDEDSAAMGRMALGALSQRIAEILKDEQFV